MGDGSDNGSFDGNAPPVAFHFSVAFAGDGLATQKVAFQEVSGLESEKEVESFLEGGENHFVHTLPKAVKHPNLRLKRGLVREDSDLIAWCKSVVDGDFSKPIEPKDLVVELIGEDTTTIARWEIGNAYPVKWSVGDFDAMRNEVAIETIELAYNTAQRTV